MLSQAARHLSALPHLLLLLMVAALPQLAQNHTTVDTQPQQQQGRRAAQVHACVRESSFGASTRLQCNTCLCRAWRTSHSTAAGVPTYLPKQLIIVILLWCLR